MKYKLPFKYNYLNTYKAIRTHLWKRIFFRIILYWKSLIISIFLMAISASTQPTFAFIMKPLLDEGFNGSKPNYLWMLPVAVIFLIFIRGLCNFLSDYILPWIANNILLGIRRDMFKQLLLMYDIDFKTEDSGRLRNKFTIDSCNMTTLSTEIITVLSKETLIIIALISLLLYMSWLLTIIVLFILPVSAFIARIFSNRLRKINRDTIDMNAELTSIIGECINGQKIIKLFNGYKYENKRFNYINSYLRKYAMRISTTDAAITPITQFCVSISVGLIIYVSLIQANNNNLTPGGFAAFMTALTQIFDPIKRLTNLTAKIQRMVIAAESVFILIDKKTEDIKVYNLFLKKPKGKIDFLNVRHCYKGSKINTLENISFSVYPGETTAILGRSGSGKTTLINTIPRFVEITSGKILIDNINILKMSLIELRNQISLVSQDITLFSDTIAANICYGSSSDLNNENKIIDAIEASNLMSFINNLPKGINTIVGENADRLSGGQRQRLAIARAIMKNSPILILDEATSSLDNESELKITKSLEKIMKNCTTLVIAHRLSTIKNSNQILMLEDSKIIEKGSHDILLKNNGLYSSFYKMQFSNNKF